MLEKAGTLLDNSLNKHLFHYQLKTLIVVQGLCLPHISMFQYDNTDH